MCGIFAVSGSRNNAKSITIAGLRKLEYRGYDSWGVSARDSDYRVRTQVKFLRLLLVIFCPVRPSVTLDGQLTAASLKSMLILILPEK